MFFLLFASSGSFAQTLKEFLVGQQIPIASFSKAELGQTVEFLAAIHDETVFLAYQARKDDLLVGPTHLATYDRNSGAVLRKDLEVDNADICSGGADGVAFFGEFTLLSASESPSAECIFVLDDKLQRLRTLYGFDPVLIAPGQVVIIENMIHFAPVHPEKLQFNDLRSGLNTELYPPKNDALRAKLAAENAAHMPSQETCTRMNDPCDPAVFDEDISAFQTDGKDRFAFIATQSANHATKEEEPPETVASQSVLYVYSRDQNKWLYCEQELEQSVIELLSSGQTTRFEDMAAHCTPNLPVVPEQKQL